MRDALAFRPRARREILRQRGWVVWSRARRIRPPPHGVVLTRTVIVSAVLSVAFAFVVARSSSILSIWDFAFVSSIAVFLVSFVRLVVRKAGETIEAARRNSQS